MIIQKREKNEIEASVSVCKGMVFWHVKVCGEVVGKYLTLVKAKKIASLLRKFPFII